MDDPNTVSLSNLLPNSKNFNFLRQQGIPIIQQLAPATWTDHNLHDPGITLLEALCYALTEAGMQAGAASASDSDEDVYTYIANLLTSAQQKAPQDFFTCAQVLPCSPVSLTDFQKVLLDHPMIQRAWVSVINGTPWGRLSVLQQFNPQVNNVITSSVTVSGTAYAINFIFPPWNDPASQPFQSDIFLHAVSFENHFKPWQQIADTGIYAALVTVAYAQPGGAAPVLSPPLSDLSAPLSVLLQIVTPLVNAGDLPQVLQVSGDLLALTGDNSDSDVTILKQYNHRLINAADENNDLNSNVFSSEVTVWGTHYEIEIAFPYWDDPETAPFQNDVTISNLVFKPGTAIPWVPIPGTDSYFAFLKFEYDGKPTSWPIVLRITSSLTGLTSDIRDAILAVAANTFLKPFMLPLLKQYNRRVMMAFEYSHRIRVYLKNYRNLCETFSAYRAVRIQEIAISASIEMQAGADIETILANIFYSIYLYISPPVVPQSLSDLQTQFSTDAIFEGPLLKHGFILDSLLNSKLSSNTLYVSDIIRLIVRGGTGTDIQTREDEDNRPVIFVTNVGLSLYLDNRSITTGARDCLQLINSVRYIPELSLEKCNITITRNNTIVPYDLNKVLDLYNEQINTVNPANIIFPGSSDIPLPVGESLAIGDYYSIQNDLPVTYGIGKAGLPASAPAERFGQARQLQGYLFFFEQVLAGYFSQLAHINALFSAKVTASTTLHQSPLYNVPGAPDLLLPTSGYSMWDDSLRKDSVWKNFTDDKNNSYRQVLKTGPETEDEFLTRRHQMLDHLLARLGEDMQDFSSLIYRQSYSDPNSSTAEASVALLQFKADYYYPLPDLEKNRAQAYGHPAWRNKDLVKIIPSPDGAFFLWQILDQNWNPVFCQSTPATSKIAAQETAEAAMVLATSKSNYTVEADLNGYQRIALRWSAGGQPIAISTTAYATIANAKNDIPSVRRTILDLWLKFSLSGLEERLYYLLGIAHKGKRRERRKLVDPAGALEGFYIIEHLLLYPVLAGDTALIIPQSSSCLPLSESGTPYSLPKDLYSFILTVVFPSGYVRYFSDDGTTVLREEAQPDRFRDPEFRRYAEQTIRKVCPAHILPIVVWVDTAYQPYNPDNQIDLKVRADPPPNKGSNPLYTSFNNLESAYRAWLRAFFRDDVDPAVIARFRNNLVCVLNGIFSDVN
jgi:hypothetical protein